MSDFFKEPTTVNYSSIFGKLSVDANFESAGSCISSCRGCSQCISSCRGCSSNITECDMWNE